MPMNSGRCAAVVDNALDCQCGGGASGQKWEPTETASAQPSQAFVEPAPHPYRVSCMANTATKIAPHSVTLGRIVKSSYMRFLSLVRAASSLPGLPALDPVEERLLNQFASFWGDDYQPTVLEALSIDEGISGRTVQRRIDGLRAKGMIRYQSDPDDQRIKRIAPTNLAIRHFSRYDKILSSAFRHR